MLRFEDIYAGKLHVNSTIFITYVESSNLSANKKQKIITLMTTYHNAFSSLSRSQKQLGYNEESGIIGEMRDKAHHVEDVVLKSLAKSQRALDDNINFTTILANSLSIIAFIIALVSSWFIKQDIIARIEAKQKLKAS